MKPLLRHELPAVPESPFVEYGEAINAAMNIVRRRGLASFIEPGDLRQQALVALVDAAPGVFPKAVVIARNAMLDCIRYQAVRQRGVVDMSFAGKESQSFDSAFFSLPVADYRAPKERIGKIRTLQSRHEEWERERSEFWAPIRSESLTAAA